ncbi:TIR protein [Imhoffiella purpurea]|uniref:TIR protein n=2 Tax=Imhoffiella purpurea TaxID=1249627 RepID=W9VCL9_9GAMM|nr:TIR protein [Imhoffiella purpurea]
MILLAVLCALLIFLSEHNYMDGLDTLLMVVGAASGLILVSSVIGSRSSKVVRKVFILYAPEDTEFVSKLYEALKISPYRILWDKKEVKVGDHIEKKTNQLLASSSDVIFVISSHSTNPEWFEPAFAKVAEQNKRLLPVLIDDSEPPEALKEFMFADFRESFDDGYLSLRDSLREVKRGRPVSKKPSTDEVAAN